MKKSEQFLPEENLPLGSVDSERDKAPDDFMVRDMIGSRVSPKYLKDREGGNQETRQSVEGHIQIFFTNGAAEKISYDIVDKPPELPVAEIKSVLEPSKDEESFVNPGSKVELNIRAKDTSEIIGGEKERASMTIEEMSASSGGSKIYLKDILPDGWKLMFDMITNTEESNGTCRIREKQLVERRMTSLTDFVALLHECGHAQDYTKKPFQEGETTWEKLLERQQMSPDAPIGRVERQQMAIAQTRERNAWASTMRVVRKFDLPISKLVKERIEKSLGSYDEVLVELDKNPASYDQFATSKKRRQYKKDSKK